MASERPVHPNRPRGERRDAKPPRLVLRFAVVTALGLAIAAAGIVVFIRHHGTTQAEQAVAFHSRYVAGAILRDELRASDFAAPVDDARRSELDEVFRTRILIDGAVRARLLSPQGRVTYSDDPALIGTSAPDAAAIRESLRGTMVTQVTTIPVRGDDEAKVLAAYLPLRFAGAQIDGVFELSHDYAPVASAARKTFLPVAGVLLFVLVALYVSLFPLLRSVTQRLRGQMREIEHQATHDDLTQLPNRVFFRERLEQALEAASRARTGVAVMIVDLDRFKEINDTLGHQSGDLLLQEVAGRLRRVFRAGDTVARLGGDEFGVVSPGAGTAASARALAERLRREVERPVAIAGLTHSVEASVGIAVFPEHGDDADTLVRRADVAMYVSKAMHAPKVYAAEQDRYSHERLALAAGLRGALEREEIDVHYEPRIDVRTGAVEGVEALMRWKHPERGLLAPAEFLASAEESGLVRDLTRHVLATAVRQSRAWRNQGLDVPVSVNLTGRDLLDLGLPDEVSSALARAGVEPGSLTLEIGEDVLVSDPARVRAVVDVLSERGVRIAVDGFARGYSSLRELRGLAVEGIKIDRSLVHDMVRDEGDAAIVRSTIGLAHDLGLRVAAEGAEDAELLARLSALGCDAAQGAHVSRPLAAPAMTRWLQKRGVERGGDVIRLPGADVVSLPARRPAG